MSPSAPAPRPRSRVGSNARVRTRALRLVAAVSVTATVLLLRPPPIAGDTAVPEDPPRWRLTYARSTAALLDLVRRTPPAGPGAIRLARPTRLPVERSVERAAVHARLAPATHRPLASPGLIRPRSRRLALDCSATAGPYPPALDLGCLPVIEPPGLQTPSVRGVSAYLDLELELTETLPTARGWSAGFAIDF